ncbi:MULTISPECIES: hypothetical protein [unclassified Lentimonas]|uniref:hypothetical protein n=1 Tax=unclassified Lentimonas TaxID=2630993 RepID=UPI0013297EB1|nr:MULTISPECIES: hypothetical protein [unclassified Lentimonas]CAA6677270.1 Unannotated [Lentimonas sp. CC4]CAA6686105.1 Unannotated [Lentimonas sp. CC6]CAA7074137.1 Unannotated [Lentimonas sp. CC4]CAA7171495.1 Unannotated [Lentimonas sp. CC21]CAA7181973.1 Unannotated [Lentimonas sp. CC8]
MQGFIEGVDGAEGWQYINLHEMSDAPSMGEDRPEILTYLERVGDGSEFRNNTEMLELWFNEDGTVNEAKVLAAENAHVLITPSRARALKLNKAYRAIVLEQDYIYGRDATWTPPQNIHPEINNEAAQTLPEQFTYPYDIRLNWQQ